MKGIFLFILLLSFGLCWGNIAEFKREIVQINIAEGKAEVTGKYWVKAIKAPARLKIFYPFPRDNYFYPDEISVIYNDTQKLDMTVNRDSQGVCFELILPDTNTVPFTVSYSQRLKGNEFRYILSTTKSWGKPLEIAEFIINVPISLKRQSISYQPDNVEINERTLRYLIKREKFWPEQDLIITWE
jgi:hypothetical protein